MAKFLVTGGAGFIGSHLVDRLISGGNKVVIVDDLSTGQKEYINPKAKFYHICITQDEIGRVFKKELPDYVYHLAAQIDVRESVTDPFYDNKINVIGSLNIFKHSVEAQVKKVIFFSSGGTIYGSVDEPAHEDFLPQPDSPYATHKFAAEKHLELFNKLFGLNYTIFRLGNVYGPRQYKGGEGAIVAVFTNNILNNKDSFVFGSGKQTRDYIYVDDVVDACLAAIKSSVNDCYNVGTGKEMNVFDVIEGIEKVVEKKINYTHASARSGEVEKSVLDIRKINKHLNWQPKTDFEAGVKKTIEWLESRKQNTKPLVVSENAVFIGLRKLSKILTLW